MEFKFKCTDCEKVFDEPRTVKMQHGVSYMPADEVYVCPFCANDEIKQILVGDEE